MADSLDVNAVQHPVGAAVVLRGSVGKRVTYQGTNRAGA
jgi:hypothetical protein